MTHRMHETAYPRPGEGAPPEDPVAFRRCITRNLWNGNQKEEMLEHNGVFNIRFRGSDRELSMVMALGIEAAVRGSCVGVHLTVGRPGRESLLRRSLPPRKVIVTKLHRVGDVACLSHSPGSHVE